MEEAAVVPVVAVEARPDQRPGPNLPSGENYAYNGILLEVTKYVSFTELKTMRQVCKGWRNVISALPRMTSCTGKFGNEWAREAGGMDYEQCIKFRSVYFRFFQFKRNTVFRPYWNFIGGENVTKLKFKFAKLPCHEMVAFLQECPHLREVYFNQCNFELVVYRTAPDRNGRAVPYRTCCTHVNGLPDLNLPPGGRIPARIRSIKFKGQNIFPLCLLDLLHQRSEGIIETFQFSEALFPRWKRLRYQPNKDTMEARMVTMLRASRDTITTFTWFKVHRGDQLLHTLTTSNVVFPNMMEMNLGQKSSWDNMNTYQFFFRFLQICCGARCRKVHVRMIHRFMAQELQAALQNKRELRELKLDGIWCNGAGVAGQLQIAAILHLCPHIEVFEMWDRNRRSQPSMTNTFVPFLPTTLKKLSIFSFYMPIQHITDYIQTRWAKQLRAFYLESGRLFTNEMMQLLIREMPQLEELGISNARDMNDAGLTGLSEQAVRTMVNCKSSIMYTHTLDESMLIGKKISEMKKLRKLSFCMSRHVSDISIYLAFKFPELREINLSWCLDVTDVGLYWLAKNNPALERIVLMKNRKVTHYGLNRLITQFPCIKNVHTSRSCRDRKMGKQLSYMESPRFNKIVTYAKWSDKRPGEYGDD